MQEMIPSTPLLIHIAYMSRKIFSGVKRKNKYARAYLHIIISHQVVSLRLFAGVVVSGVLARLPGSRMRWTGVTPL